MQGFQSSSRFALLGGALSLVMMVGGCTLSSGNGGGGNGAGGKTDSGGATGSGGSTPAGTGGKVGTGGSASGGANGTGGAAGSGGGCTNVAPCGGDLTGTWTVDSSCLSVSGKVDLSNAGASCDSADVTGTLHVSGTFTVSANGNFTDKTTTTGEEQIKMGAACKVVSSTPTTCKGAGGLLASALGFTALDCTDASDGGCDCKATVKQDAGLGIISLNAMATGKAASANNTITLTGDSDDTHYPYCVSGDKLTLVPKIDSPTIGGSIVFKKGTPTGTGGSAGTSGQPGSGGSAGSGGGTTGKGGAAGGTGAGGATGGTTGGSAPCDIYGAGNTPCVAAHSVVRALYSAYNGKLYQVRRASDNTTKDILTVAAGGLADTGPEDTFCAGTTCVLTAIYDQSPKGNDLWYQGSTQVPASTSSKPSNATKDSVTVGGHKMYSVYISPGNCYWHDGSKSGMAIGADPEGMYMVTSSRNANGGCCFDYGNSETDRSADGAGAMDSLNFSTTTAWGTGAGNGPWVMADLEYGLFSQGSSSKNPNDPTQTAPFVTAVLKNNGKTEYALRGADATTGNLATYYKGALPGGWSPMKKQGAIILGCGGDCCKPSGGANASSGIFFEGAVVTGYPTDATEDAIQANIVAAGYGK